MKRVILMMAALSLPVFGQTETPAPMPPTDYFNQGSATFIRETPEKALSIVTEGLVHYPDNEPLIRLKE